MFEDKLAQEFDIRPSASTVRRAQAVRQDYAASPAPQPITTIPYTGEAYYRKRHPAVKHSQEVCLTNQFFNGQAQENAKLNNVQLLDQYLLGELLQKHPTTMLEVDQVLYTRWETATAE